MMRWLREYRGFIVFLFCFGFFRLAIADWNPIPSGSMRPTLLEGDVVLVDRLAYDFKLPLSNIVMFKLGTPRRGDVIVFTSPKDGVRLIKRLMALPGDVVEMRDEVLYINDSASEYVRPAVVPEAMDYGATVPAIRATERVAGSEHLVQFLPDVPSRRSFGPIVVPKGNYFFLGDNRDNSADSRFIGFVPRNLLIGRAHHILVSADIKGDWFPRFDRTGERIR